MEQISLKGEAAVLDEPSMPASPEVEFVELADAVTPQGEHRCV